MARCRKQLLLKLGVFLLLGVVVNVAVAWIAAITAEYHSENAVLAESVAEGWTVVIDNEPAMQFVYSRKSPHESGRPHLPSETTDLDPRQVIPNWSRLGEQDSYSGFPTRNVVSYGWPVSTLWCEYKVRKYLVTTTSPCEIVGGIQVGIGKPLRVVPIASLLPRALPLRPIWPGFAINTIFYASLLWVLCMVPGKIRRFVRIRRGCCPACGYKIAPGGGLGPRCSECGYELRKVEKSKVES